MLPFSLPLPMLADMPDGYPLELFSHFFPKTYNRLQNMAKSQDNYFLIFPRLHLISFLPSILSYLKNGTHLLLLKIMIIRHNRNHEQLTYFLQEYAFQSLVLYIFLKYFEFVHILEDCFQCESVLSPSIE